MDSGRRALKVLHIDPEKGWGGGECQVLGLLSYLSRRGHQNHLLSHPEGALFGKAGKTGAESFPLTVRNDIDFRPVFALRKLLQKERYDIVHFHTKRAHALSLWLARSHSEVRHVVTRRMDYPIRTNWYSDYLYNRQVDGVVAISRRIADLLVEGGVRREKIRVIHSGIDPAPFQKSALARPNAAAMIIGTVAVLEERKGHRFLLEAAALLKKQGHHLKYRFAGVGSERMRLERLVVEMGLERDVEFSGFISDVPVFLSGIDLFVLPSLYEGLGVAVLEAMAAGRAVVATNVGGLREIVEDGITGLLVPDKDPRALAGAVGTMVLRTGLAQQMGARGRERALRHFTMEEMARKNEEFYYELLQMHPGRGWRMTKEEVPGVGI